MTDDAISSPEDISPPTGIRTSHFWVASSQFFETVLFALSTDPQLTTELDISLFDADGLLVNEAALALPNGQIGVMELQMMLEGCKLESGLQHAHLVVHHPPHVAVHCRMHTRETASLLLPAPLFSQSQSVFFPVTFSSERSYLVSILNAGNEEAQFKCRLFSGKRSPEVIKTIPPNGSRIVSLTADFAEYITYETGRLFQTYIRLTTRDSFVLGVQLIERTELSKDHFLYSSVG